MRTDLALAALASAAVPGMKPVAVAAMGPGDDDRASELQSALVEDATGRRWVVRAPLTAVAGARLQRNDELVRQLSRHVPFKVPAAVGYAPVGRDGSAAVYPYVEGSPLDLRRLPAGPGLTSAVGRALAAVHNIPRAVFEEQDVPLFDASGARQRAIAEVDRAAETGRVPTGLLARWEEAFEAAPLWQFATTPVHGSFTGASVVVAFTDEQDSATGRVVAVTDWDEAMVGDPAVDLAELWTRSSRQAWEAVLDSYTLARAHRPDPYLHARARLVAELRNLRGLARAVADGDEDEARRAVEALRRVDRLTEADDSLVPVTARPSGARPGGFPESAVPVDVAAAGQQEPHGRSGPEVGAADPTMEVPAPTTGAVSPPAADGTDRPGTADEADQTGQTVRADRPHEPDERDERVEADERGDVPSRMGSFDLPAEPTAEREPERTDDDATVQIDPKAPPPFPAEAEDASAAGGDGPSHDQVSGFGAPEGRPEPGGADEKDAGDAAAPAEDDDASGRLEHRPAEDGDAALADGELQDDERLHELYGMPAPDQDPQSR